MDFLRFSASNAPIRLIRVPLRRHIPRRWHSGPLYENVKKKDEPVLQQKPAAQDQSQVPPVKRPTDRPIPTQSNAPSTPSPNNPHVSFTLYMNPYKLSLMDRGSAISIGHGVLQLSRSYWERC